MDNKFYDGCKLLSLKDINGEQPELYICTSNRSAGKTVFFNRWVVKRFINHNEKFCLIYRFKYELEECSEKFFSEIKSLFFERYNMTHEKRCNGLFVELFLNGVPCGYAISLNSADQLKKYSHLLNDTVRMLFDEFQSETNNYAPLEVKKFISVHTSIARGCGDTVKYLPVYLIGNLISIVNPYYVELGICDLLKEDTTFLRGNGFVLEQGFNEHTASKQKESGFFKAFNNNSYVTSNLSKNYLNDNNNFIEKNISKNSAYFCTLVNGGKFYGVWNNGSNLIISKKTQPNFNLQIAVEKTDHTEGTILLGRGDYIINSMREFYKRGLCVFDSQECKSIFFKCISL